MPRVAIIGEIEGLVDKFATTAERAQKAGFEGVEANAGTCHLINNFLSRAWNKLQDIYGCESLQNRARFVVEIIQEIKKRACIDVLVTILINIAEFGIEQGTIIEEVKGLA